MSTIETLPTTELAALWPTVASAHRGARTAIENALIERAKGGPGSGNWGHTSHTRTGQLGGSDPGGGLATLGIGYGSTPQERQEQAERYRAMRGSGPRVEYRAFGSVAEADQWVQDNEEWIGGIRQWGLLSDPQKIEVASTLRQVRELFPQRQKFTDRGIVFSEGADSEYRGHVYDHYRRVGMSHYRMPNEIEISTRMGYFMGAEPARSAARFFLETAATSDNPEAYRRMAARQLELATGVETGRWPGKLPHSFYTMMEEPTRAAVLHESGHWLLDVLYENDMNARKQIDGFARRFYEERDSLSPTTRGADNYLECFAENWTLYAAGRQHMVDPEHLAIFQSATREEQTWPME